MVKVEIGSNDAGQRLDRFLRKYLKKASLSAVYKIIRKDLKINGKRAKEDTVLKEGDVLSKDYIEKLPNEQQEICNSLNRRTEFRVLRTTYNMFEK